MRWCLDHGVSALITSPVSCQDLAYALCSALESSTVGPVTTTDGAYYSVLLAEDNKVNQELAAKLLRKHGDHVVDMADNGSIAVDLFKSAVQKSRPYDIVLVCMLLFPCLANDITAHDSRWICLCRSWVAWRRLS